MGLLTNFKIYTLLAFIISLLLSGLFYQHAKAANAQRDKAITELHIIGEKLKEQNAAIAKWQLQGEQQREQLKYAEAAAEKEKADYEKRIQAILLKPVPAECGGAVRWGAVEAERLAGQWR